MNDTRERFEEIWPVPEGVYWIDYPGGGYYAPYKRSMYEEVAEDWNGRLQVFTRCQETMAPVFSLIEEMISEFEADQIWYPWLDRAKQIMEQKK